MHIAQTNQTVNATDLNASYLAYCLLTERHDGCRTARKEIFMDFLYAISLGAIPLLAIIICFVVTWIWGD
ncbi:MAG: hypothetical protein HXY51_17475 [Nitrospirae bacterium]|nr:hypothetical protein [Nitrospirota bacterium]